jgi:phosphoribosylamine---glycine ligase
MRVLVVGSGGREHALCWAISPSPLLTELWCAPGNAGTADVAKNVPIDSLDILALVAFAKNNEIDLVVPGPEAPLVAGLADALEEEAIPCCGPSSLAAQLEGSKTFAKQLCDHVGIPTALWERFDDAEHARDFVRRRGAPVVIKADGLAAGKGVVVAETEAEALAAIKAMTEDRTLGAAGETIVIEERLHGPEISFFALCDGTDALPIGAAQDYKRVGERDTGPNTGGMGAISPPPLWSDALQEEALTRVVRPALAELAHRGSPFRGILFAGLMLTEQGLKLIEFNVRFGDPECQALVLRLKSDLLAALVAACDGELRNFDLRLYERPSVAVVLAARGYPGPPARGGEIRGLEAEASLSGAEVFHAATRAAEGKIIADGGRVLTICATGDNLANARDIAYRAIANIDWPDGFCRRDIGLS